MVVRDVVLRDGLQDEPVLVPVAGRVRIGEALAAAGLRAIEAVSFVNPDRVPQMAGAEGLVTALRERLDTDSVRLSGLALNPAGVVRAAASGIDEIQLVVSATDGHSRANAGRLTREVLARFATLTDIDMSKTAAVATAFVCPFDGPVPPDRLVEVVAGCVELGVVRVALADTLGTASTEHVRSSVAAVLAAFPDLELALHLHDGRGQAVATVNAAIEQGIRHFDAAVGGYGGCPFAPGAHGNLATERLVDHLHAAGLTTGIDTGLLTVAAAVVAAELAAALPVITPALS